MNTNVRSIQVDCIVESVTQSTSGAVAIYSRPEAASNGEREPGISLQAKPRHADTTGSETRSVTAKGKKCSTTGDGRNHVQALRR
jgi:hypothetical protein